MSHPKFIITSDGHLRLGMVSQHKDLLLPSDHCVGGGYYEFDYVRGKLILDRSSYDFGEPQWGLFDTLKVPSSCRGLRLVYAYDDGRSGDFDISATLTIEYYD